MVTLVGPSLVHGYPKRIKISGKKKGALFLVSYQTWDSGNYKVHIDSDCSLESYSSHGSWHRLAHMWLKVSPPYKSCKQNKIISPCSLGQFARWTDIRNVSERKIFLDSKVESPVRRRDSRFIVPYTRVGIPPVSEKPYIVLKPYKCAVVLQPLETFAGALLRKGIQEVSLVGDSHFRTIFTQLQTMIDGSFSGDLQDDRLWYIYDKKLGKSLRLNLYWMPGIYKDGEFGCERKLTVGDPPWKQFSNTSDVIVLGASSWTIAFCKDPIGSYTRQLPQFMKWNINLPHKPNARFFWRTAPPIPSNLYVCSQWRNARSSFRAETNRIARHFAPKYGIEILDFWPIEAPRYLDNCVKEKQPGVWFIDGHYSCPYQNNTKSYGVVGEAVARLFVHMLVNL